MTNEFNNWLEQEIELYEKLIGNAEKLVARIDEWLIQQAVERLIEESRVPRMSQ